MADGRTALSQHRRKASVGRRPGRRIGAFLITTVLAASLIAAVSVLMIRRMPGSGTDPLADSVASIPSSKTIVKLEQWRQRVIITAAAAQTFSVASTPKLTAPVTPTPPPAGTVTTTDPTVPSGPPPDPGTAQSIAYNMIPSFGWSASGQFGCLNDIWTRESGWRYNAENASGAYGIPQALPGDKMASAGPDWQTDPTTQIKWGLGYIQQRYGSPCSAWAFWQDNGWY